MRVGIFETEHFEGAYPVIKLFDNGQNQITIFTYENCFHQFKFLFADNVHKYNWVVKKKSESKYQFIYRLFKNSRKAKFDVLYLNTIADNHILYALMVTALRGIRIITTLHDINSYFSPGKPSGFRRLVRYIGKRFLVISVEEFNVVSSTMVEYLQAKLSSSKKVHCVPGSVYEGRGENSVLQLTSQLRIVVPGTIDVRRRNYDSVFKLLELANQKNIPLTMVLLGGSTGAYGGSVLEKCKQYALRNINLQFFETEVVDQPVFDEEMDRAHLVFIPSVIDTILGDGVPEKYGLSISSGNIFDIIKHAKPFIAPFELRIPENLESSCFKYSGLHEVIAFLQNIAENKSEYITWREKAIENSDHYTVENIRGKNTSLFS